MSERSIRERRRRIAKLHKQAEDPRSRSLVLGGGFMLGPCEAGVLQYLEDNDVAIHDTTCISIGTTIGVFYANGYSPRQIARIFAHEVAVPYTGFIPLLPLITGVMHLSNPLRWWSLGACDLSHMMEHLCNKYQLRCQPNLRILIWDMLRLRPLVWEGTDDKELPKAMAAASSIPGLFGPVIGVLGGKRSMYMDYGLVHPHPTQFADRKPAIVTKLLHSGVFDTIWPDSPGELTVNASHPNHSPFPPITKIDVAERFAHGYAEAEKQLGKKLKKTRVTQRRKVA